MRYLFILLLLSSLQAQGQKSMEQLKHMDFMFNGGVLFPAGEKQKYAGSNPLYNHKTNTAALAEIGLEIFASRQPSSFKFSFGSRIGYMSLMSKDGTGDIDTGRAFHGCISLGVNYFNDYSAAAPLRLGVIGGAGFRVDNANSFGLSPFFYAQLMATKYFNRSYGLGLNITRYFDLNTAYTYNAYSTRLQGGNTFDIWSVSIELRLSINRKPGN